MTSTDYAIVVEYTKQLPEWRKSYPDWQLLDLCYKIMQMFVEFAADAPLEPPPSFQAPPDTPPPVEPPPDGGKPPWWPPGGGNGGNGGQGPTLAQKLDAL